jgi:hypothetical protein
MLRKEKIPAILLENQSEDVHLGVRNQGGHFFGEMSTSVPDPKVDILTGAA